jgi:hypothetical protein
MRMHHRDDKVVIAPCRSKALRVGRCSNNNDNNIINNARLPLFGEQTVKSCVCLIHNSVMELKINFSMTIHNNSFDGGDSLT